VADLDVGDLRKIESWAGPLSSEDVVVAIRRMTDLGNATVVAYEFLKIRYAGMLNSPDELRIEGDARVRWVEAKKQLAVQVGRCLDAIRLSGETLNPAAGAVVDADLLALGGRRISTKLYVSPNPRP
jgi:hypothetical protein